MILQTFHLNVGMSILYPIATYIIVWNRDSTINSIVGIYVLQFPKLKLISAVCLLLDYKGLTGRVYAKNARHW